MWELGAEEKSARTGSLMDTIATPAFTIPTRRGMPVNILPDTLASLMGAFVWQMPLAHVASTPPPKRRKVEQCPLTASLPVPPVSKLYNLANTGRIITYMPVRSCAGDIHGWEGDALLVESTNGRAKITDATFRHLAEQMSCDIICAMSEEVKCDTNSRQAARAHRRALEHVDGLVEKKILKRDSPTPSSSSYLLAPVQGGSDKSVRIQAAQDFAKRDVQGYQLGGFGYDETLDQRLELLQASCEELPRQKPRFLPLRSGSLTEVLDAVKCGIDMIELEYPFTLATEGKALVFVEPSRSHVLDLKDDQFREDFSVVEKGSVTEPYSRAYIHHLLHCDELLGTMLLARHNLVKYVQFFEGIRRHIAEGSFASYYASWKSVLN